MQVALYDSHCYLFTLSGVLLLILSVVFFSTLINDPLPTFMLHLHSLVSTMVVQTLYYSIPLNIHGIQLAKNG